MEFKIEKVLERDMDLLIINNVINNNLLQLFLNKLNLKNYKIINVEHSYVDADLGESDITIIVEKDKHRIGLLIEDKIDAPAMNLQPERYFERGKRGISSNKYDEFKTFIIAPEQYLKTNSYVEKYQFQISYEEILDVLSDDIYASTIINKAIEEKKNGYVIVENPNVTLFWEQYYAIIRQNYQGIKINEVHGPRGNNACWPELTTYYPNVKIIQKSDRGFLDLTFSKMGNYPNIFHRYLDHIIEEDMSIEKTNKSMVVRVEITPIDFRGQFDSQIDKVKECLNKALRLYKLLNNIDVDSMYKEIEEKNSDIKSLEDFDMIFPNGIIVNYDLRGTYRSSTKTIEAIADIVDYPYIQRYQTGINPRTQLFIIKDNTLQRIKRIMPDNPDSNYYIEDINESVSEDFYKDSKFLKITHNPVNVFTEELLEIINNEDR